MKKYEKFHAKEFNLSIEEFNKIINILGRSPNLLEISIFSVMWSEHCSYKSTKKWLKFLPTKAPWVICGPGENAGIISIGDDDALVFKMESHNHPSFIEPYQGAATGVGGIMRDIFTMGARPIANLNSLRFGSIKNRKTRYLLNGVVAGIGDYGNCVGVPTVGGECYFHECYNENILVNAMCVGLVKKNKIFYSIAKGENYPIMYVGAKTGRDGIHGATMASAEFNLDSEKNRPQVQVGDPFTEKLLLEACLELMNTNALIAIQDMGAAGLTSSSFEMASKGNKGIILNLDKIPTREGGMQAFEIMLSETQERMLMIVKPGHVKTVKKIFDKWELESVEIGRLTNDGKMKIFHKNKLECSISIKEIVNNSPEYDRPSLAALKPKNVEVKIKNLNLKSIIKKLLSHENTASKKWIFSQYDQSVMCDTVCGPEEADAAVIRIHNSSKAIAITSDCNPIYCKSDPYKGAIIAVAESWRNLISVGSHPLAITNNLNFGNPEKKEIMNEIKESIKGIKHACETLNYPVVSGNVSLYNDTLGKSIYPTPVIGGVGLIENIKNIKLNRITKGSSVFLIGKTSGHLQLSSYQKIIIGTEEGIPPEIDLKEEKKNGLFIKNLIKNNSQNIVGIHDISEGGILIALSELIIKNNIGISLSYPPTSDYNKIISYLLGEDQSRYLVITTNKEFITKEAKKKNIKCTFLGTCEGEKLKIKNIFEISNKEIINYNKIFFRKYCN